MEVLFSDLRESPDMNRLDDKEAAGVVGDFEAVLDVDEFFQLPVPPFTAAATRSRGDVDFARTSTSSGAAACDAGAATVTDADGNM